MNSIILVTGATGNVASELVRRLHADGQPLRAAVVSVEVAGQLPAGVPWTLFDFTDPATYAEAFVGVKKLFLLRPPQIANVARDIAAVAARVLTRPGHTWQAYRLTGAEAVDYGAVAAMLSEALRRPIRYSNPSFLRFAWRFWRRGHPPGYVTTITAIYLTTRLGLAQTVSPDTTVLLGRSPISMGQFITDHAPLWQKRRGQQANHNETVHLEV